MKFKEAQEMIDNNLQYIMQNIPLQNNPPREYLMCFVAPPVLPENQNITDSIIEMIRSGQANEVAILETVPQLWSSNELYAFVIVKMEGFNTIIKLDSYLESLEAEIEAGKSS